MAGGVKKGTSNGDNGDDENGRAIWGQMGSGCWVGGMRSG